MLGPLEGMCQIILEHMFRLCCWRVPSTHEMSIKTVRAARITDTTLEKHSIFYICRPDSTGVDRGSGRGLLGPRYGKHSPKMGQDCLKMWQHRPHTVSKRERERDRERQRERERDRERERHRDREDRDREDRDRDRDRDRQRPRRRQRQRQRQTERGEGERERGPSPTQTQVGRRPAVRRKPSNNNSIAVAQGALVAALASDSVKWVYHELVASAGHSAGKAQQACLRPIQTLSWLCNKNCAAFVARTMYLILFGVFAFDST